MILNENGLGSLERLKFNNHFIKDADDQFYEIRFQYYKK